MLIAVVFETVPEVDVTVTVAGPLGVEAGPSTMSNARRH